MSGNTTSLYSTSSSNGTTGSNNFTTLYPSQQGVIVPTTPYGNANVVALLAAGTDGSNTVSNVIATGNVTGNYFLGNGSQLTGIVAVSANTAVTVTGNAQPNITSVGTLTSLSSTGNVTGGNMLTAGAVSAAGNVTGNYILGNGSQLTGLGATYSNANVATFLANFGSNTISTTGNITGGFILGNGSQLTGLPATYSNANVTSLLANFGSNSISTTGNVTANYVIGNGSLLSDITGGNVTGSVAQANTANTANAVAGANVSGQVANALIAGTVYTNAQPNITSVGTLTSATVTGNITGGNLLTAGVVSATGNITGNVFSGNGAGLTNINAGNIVGSYGNANVANFLGSYGSNTLSTTGNVTTGNLNVQLDAVITGNLTVNGNTTLVNSNVVTINDKFINVANNASTAAQANGGGLGVGPVGTEYATLTYNSTNNDWNTNIPLSVTGNVTAGNFVGNGSLLTSITGANVTGTVANATYATSAGTAGSANTAVTVTGNAQANITSVGTLTSLSVSGNVTGGNISATGNIYAPNVAIIDGTILGQVLASNIAAGNLGLNVISANAYIGGRIRTGLEISAAGDVIGANILTGGAVSATGNVTGNYFLGNGSQLTGLPATYSNANVVSLMAAFGSNAISTTGNITASYFLGNGSQLTGLPATYSNANVVSLMAAFGSNSISTTGNVTAGYFLGNGSQLTGLTGNITPTASGNINMNGYNIFDSTRTYVLINDGLSAVGNITTANYVTASQAIISGTVQTSDVNVNTGNVSLGSTGIVYAAGNITGANLFTGGLVSATGNILSGASISAVGRIYGSGLTVSTGGINSTGAISGSQLTVTASVYGTGNVTAGNLYTGGSANVGTLVTMGNAEIGTNLSVTGGITAPGSAINAGSLSVTGNIRGGGAGYNLNMNSGNLINIGAGGATTAIALNGNIEFSGGNINMPAGAMSASGNITGNYFIGNGSQLTGITAGTATTAVTVTGNAQPNITSVGILTAVNTSGAVSATGNVTGSYIVGNGSLLTSITGANVTGTVANATYAVSAGSATTATSAGTAATVTDAAQPNITSVGTLTSITSTGNVTGGNLLTGGIVSSTGNVTGNYFIGNGSQLTGIATSAPGGNTAEIQYNNGGAFAANAAMTFDNTTGNVTLANVIIGTTGAGNTTLGGNAQRINTSNAYTGTSLTNNGFLSGQIVIGNGFFGNLDLRNVQARPAGKFNVWDSANLTEVGSNTARYQTGGFSGMLSIGNMVQTGSLVRGGIGTLAIGGGPSANVWSATGQGMGAVLAFNQFLAVGQPNTVAALGNVTLSGAAAMLGQHFVYAGSNVGNAGGVNSQINNSGNITNAIGLTSQFSGTPTLTPTNVFGFYMPGTTNSYGPTNSNGMRAATNYYFLRNDDAVAQNQLGSLRAYHTFQAAGNTTGTWDIDKQNGQVQAVSLTGNVTIGSYTNFVTTANDGTNNDNQTDTVTLIIEQGATPYTVTMPTGNTSIRYENGNSTVSSTANSTVTVQIQAYRSAANATAYITTISPAFT